MGTLSFQSQINAHEQYQINLLLDSLMNCVQLKLVSPTLLFSPNHTNAYSFSFFQPLKVLPRQFQVTFKACWQCKNNSLKSSQKTFIFCTDEISSIRITSCSFVVAQLWLLTAVFPQSSHLDVTASSTLKQMLICNTAL